MSTAARIAGLTFIPAGVVGITQFHYVVSHLSQIATGATALGLGVAVWGGHSVMGKVKLRNAERKQAAAVEAAKQAALEDADGKQREFTNWIHEQYEQIQRLPQGQPTRTWDDKRVIDLGRVER